MAIDTKDNGKMEKFMVQVSRQHFHLWGASQPINLYYFTQEFCSWPMEISILESGKMAKDTDRERIFTGKFPASYIVD